MNSTAFSYLFNQCDLQRICEMAGVKVKHITARSDEQKQIKSRSEMMDYENRKRVRKVKQKNVLASKIVIFCRKFNSLNSSDAAIVQSSQGGWHQSIKLWNRSNCPASWAMQNSSFPLCWVICTLNIISYFILAFNSTNLSFYLNSSYFHWH